MTKDEVRAIPSGSHVSCLLNNGRLGSVKITSIKTWKREPERIEVGVKYGMYEFTTFDAAEAAQRFVVEV